MSQDQHDAQHTNSIVTFYTVNEDQILVHVRRHTHADTHTHAHTHTKFYGRLSKVEGTCQRLNVQESLK